MKHSIAVQGVRFSAAHRIRDHPICGSMHGHNYELRAQIAVTQFDAPFILDFQRLKAVLRDVATHLDHKYLCTPREEYHMRSAHGSDMHSREQVLINTHATSVECLLFPIGSYIIQSLWGYPSRRLCRWENMLHMNPELCVTLCETYDSCAMFNYSTDDLSAVLNEDYYYEFNHVDGLTIFTDSFENEHA